MINLGLCLVVIGNPCHFVLEESQSNLQAVQSTEVNKAVAVLCALSKSMRAQDVLKALSVSTYLGIHIAHDNSYAMLWDFIDKIL